MGEDEERGMSEERRWKGEWEESEFPCAFKEKQEQELATPYGGRNNGMLSKRDPTCLLGCKDTAHRLDILFQQCKQRHMVHIVMKLIDQFMGCEPHSMGFLS